MKPKIIFMGTPEFAVPSLKILAENNYPIIGVVTQPDRPRGRGRSLSPPPIKVAAERYGLPVIQPERVRDEKYLETFRKLSPTMVVLVAFGQILPREIIDFPEMGCINVHPSLLPKYRGAAPINWALIRGEERTGVTTILMDEGVDSGDILLQEGTMIEPDEAYGTLYGRLSQMGANLLLKTVKGIEKGSVTSTPQDHSLATCAPRLKKEDGIINWEADVRSIINLIRGLSPSPGAYTFLNGKKLKILTATGKESSLQEKAGMVVCKTEMGLQVAANDGYVYLKEVQLENRKTMSIFDFLRGCKISPGETFD